MSDDKIAEIRKRHSRDERWRYSPSMICPQMHDDRATLLAEVDSQRAEIERLRENVDRAGKEAERADRLRAEIARVKADEKKSREKNEKLRAEIERMREAMTDMLSGWRYIRETYGDLAGVGWDRVEQKARNALEGKP